MKLVLFLFAALALADAKQFSFNKLAWKLAAKKNLLQIDEGEFPVINANLDLQINADGNAVSVVQGMLDNEAVDELDLISAVFDVFVDSADADNQISTSTSNHLSFAAGGQHEITLSGNLVPADQAVAEAFFSDFIQGNNVNLVADGEGADSAVEFDISVSGLNVPLIDGVLEDDLDTTTVLGDVLLGRTTEVLGSRFALTNPFSADIFITELHFDVIFQGDTIGRIDDVEDGDGILLPAHTTTLADKRDVTLDITGGALNDLLALNGDIANGAVTLSTTGSFVFKVGDFTASIDYSQDVRACQCGTPDLATACGDVVASGC